MIRFSISMLIRFLTNYDYSYVIFLTAFANIIMRAAVRWFWGGRNYANN